MADILPNVYQELAKVQAELEAANAKFAELDAKFADVTTLLEQAQLRETETKALLVQTTTQLNQALELERQEAASANQNLKSIKEHLDALQTEQGEMTLASNTKLAELQAKLDVAISAQSNLTAEKSSFEQEKTELAAKVSELEVEVLEAKEAAETAQEESTKALAALKQTHWEEKDALTKSLQEDLRVAGEKHEQASRVWEATSAAMDDMHQSEKESALSEAKRASEEASNAALADLVAKHEALVSEKDGLHSSEVEELKKTHEEAQASSREVIAGLNTEIQVCRHILHRLSLEGVLNDMPLIFLCVVSTRQVRRSGTRDQG